MEHAQACALRLFREQGYDATTIEQIIDAAASPTNPDADLLALIDRAIAHPEPGLAL